MEKKFKIRVSCANCNAKDEVEFERGTNLREIGYGDNISIMAELPNGEKEYVVCPNCDSGRLVKVL